jgi:hypothetical protein
MTSILILSMLCSTASNGDGVPKGESKPRQDAVAYRMPDDRVTKDRLTRAADWFKLGVLRYAIRLLGMEPEIGPRLGRMKQRLWDSQTESGGVSHFVDARGDGGMARGRGPTGEATAIAILAEVVGPLRPAPDK